MTVVITGASGMLGSDLMRVLGERWPDGGEVIGLPRADLDITDAAAVADALAGATAVVNCAAYTRVDDAEDDEDVAYAVNAIGARNVARAAAASGARLIQLSTDYVFDGEGTVPYPEDHPLDPVSAYGRTKAAGERFVRDEHPDGAIVLRTAWLYGADGSNFVRTMLRLADADGEVRVVDDQVGQPTWSADVARVIRDLLVSDIRSGIFHATSAGSVSWFGFARRIFELAGHEPGRVVPIVSAQFARRAPRPRFSVLGHAGWTGSGIQPIRDWQGALGSAMRAGAFGAA